MVFHEAVLAIYPSVLHSVKRFYRRYIPLWTIYIPLVSLVFLTTTFCVTASTVHPYVSRARHLLGDQCPSPKMVNPSAPNGSVCSKDGSSADEMDELEDPIDGDAADGTFLHMFYSIF